jgi:hypothetical protein
VAIISSLEKPQLVPARAFKMQGEPIAFTAMALARGENVKCISQVTPRIMGVLSRGMVPFQIVADGWYWDWCISGVKSVNKDLPGATPVSFQLTNLRRCKGA